MRRMRDYLLGEKGAITFEPTRSIEFPTVSRADLYLHIPFCRSLCPYCPYNRILYDEKMIPPYLNAVLAEIDAWHARLGSIEIGSVYIGGGTPTTMLDEMPQILERLRERFVVSGDIAIETIPTDLNEESVRRLRECGINLLSIGVQSFNDRYLKSLGRPYHADILEPALSTALSAGFGTVNVDLMFALPGQTTEEALADLHKTIELGVDQITLYPLFTFSYSAIGRHIELKDVRFPRLLVRRNMYRAIHNTALSSDLERVSVWGFKREAVPKFSSVTRDDYIGIGAGAGSCLPGVFFFNTFSVPEYIEASDGKNLPVALKSEMSPALENYYWLYWRLYETRVPKRELARRFGNDVKIRWMFRQGKALGMLAEEAECYVLTERGSFWIHLIQNYYVLNYIDKLWTRAIQEPWPGRIEL